MFFHHKKGQNMESLYGYMISESNNMTQPKIRLPIVRYAQKNGIKACSRHFGCSKNTVKLWLRRYESKGSSGLQNKTRRPRYCPHKTSKEEEMEILACRRQAPCYGPKRLKWFFDINASEGAIARILKEHKLVRKRRKKYQIKNDLREAKAKYKALTRFQLDVKHLYDIPYYWPQMTKKKLPKYEYTLRDVKTGMVFLGYGSEYSETYSSLFMDLFLSHLTQLGLDVTKCIIQTDNGPEFSGTKRKTDTRGFNHMLHEKYSVEQRFIPPGCCNANADVESFHHTIEEEFFNLESFTAQEDFWIKIQAYQYFYNMSRPNFSKKGKTPQQILFEDLSDFDPSFMLYPVINLDQNFRVQFNLKNKGGQNLPNPPEKKLKLRKETLIVFGKHPNI